MMVPCRWFAETGTQLHPRNHNTDITWGKGLSCWSCLVSLSSSPQLTVAWLMFLHIHILSDLEHPYAMTTNVNEGHKIGIALGDKDCKSSTQLSERLDCSSYDVCRRCSQRSSSWTLFYIRPAKLRVPWSPLQLIHSNIAMFFDCAEHPVQTPRVPLLERRYRLQHHRHARLPLPRTGNQGYGKDSLLLTNVDRRDENVSDVLTWQRGKSLDG